MSDDAASMRALAERERAAGRGDRAIAAYEEAVALLRREDDLLRLAHTIRHLGDVHVEENHLTAAEPCYSEALRIYRGAAEAPVLDLANAIRSMAVLKERVGERAEAAALWVEAGRLYERANVEAGVKESTRRAALLAPGKSSAQLPGRGDDETE